MRNRRIALFQSSDLVLRVIQKFLLSEGVRATLTFRKDRKRNNLGYVLRQWQLHVVDKPSVEKTLWAVRPYVVVKKQRVEDLWRYLRLYPRLSNQVTGGLSTITERHISRKRRQLT